MLNVSACRAERRKPRSSEVVSATTSTPRTLNGIACLLPLEDRLEQVGAGEKLRRCHLADGAGTDVEVAEAGIPVAGGIGAELAELVLESSPLVDELPFELRVGGPASSPAGSSDSSRIVTPNGASAKRS